MELLGYTVTVFNGHSVGEDSTCLQDLAREEMRKGIPHSGEVLEFVLLRRAGS